MDSIAVIPYEPSVDPTSLQPIDCDIHPAIPTTRALLPYLDDYWREHITRRGLEADNLELSCLPGQRAAEQPGPTGVRRTGPPAPTSTLLRGQVLDAFHSRFAICNVLNGAQVLHSEDLSAALCRAINDWIAGGVAGP